MSTRKSEAMKLLEEARKKKPPKHQVVIYVTDEFHAEWKSFCKQQGVSMNVGATLALKHLMESVLEDNHGAG